MVGGEMTLRNDDMCPNCQAWHGVWPLEAIPRDAPCPFVMGQRCTCCGTRVSSLSFGGPTRCAYCDTGACHKYGHPYKVQ